MNRAQTLRTLAGMLEDGVPAPLAVNLSDAGVSVQVLVENIGDWLTYLDLPEPVWDVVAEAGWSRATWPAGTFDGLPFQIICVAVSDREFIETAWRATS